MGWGGGKTILASGDIASGSIGPSVLASGAIVSGQIGNNAVVSGSIASGQVGWPHIANAAIQSGQIQSGTISQMHIINAGIVSGNIASGSISQFHLASGAINSGHIASGTIATYSLNTYFEDFVANETVSGNRAVCITSGGTVVAAQGASGLRMPAIGVAANDVLSGSSVRVIMGGRINVTAVGNMSTWSGQIGNMLYVSTSGFQITSTKPTTSIVQRIGVGISGGLLVLPDMAVASGNAAASASGGF